jgi:putative transposase
MTKGLVRYQHCGVFHFLTFSCYRRQALLGDERAYRIFAQELEAVRVRYGFVVVGYVLMPEHVHLLVGEPRQSSLAVALQVLKQSTSRKLKPPRRRSVLAASLLRFQRVERGKTNRETTLYAR